MANLDRFNPAEEAQRGEAVDVYKKAHIENAEKFSKWLEGKVQGVLTVEGPTKIDNESKKWIVRLNGNEIGKYITRNPHRGEEKSRREFYGVIPGYVNDFIEDLNRTKPKSEQKPVGTVGLEYSNVDGNYQRTAWQRKDGHTEIPFP